MVSDLIGSLCSNNVIRTQFLSPSLGSTFLWLISLPGRVLTHGGWKSSSSSRLLFLWAQQSQWENSFSFSIIPEKILKLASHGSASSCAHSWTNYFGLGGIICDLDHAYPWSKKWGQFHLNFPDLYWRRDSSQRKMWVLLLKQWGKMLGRQNKRCPLYLYSWIIAESSPQALLCLMFYPDWSCRIEQALFLS